MRLTSYLIDEKRTSERYKENMEKMEKWSLTEGYTIKNNLLSHISPAWISKRKLKAGDKKKLNTELQKVLKQTYFKSIPLNRLFKIFEKHGVMVIQEDNTEWSGMLVGGVKKTEMVNFNLGWKDEMQELHGKKAYMAVPNSVFTMTYFKMPSGKYEVIGYVS